MTALRRAAALCAFSTRANLRSRPARLGALVFALVTALGQALALTRPRGAPEDDRLFGYAFLVGAVLILRSGLAEQRRGGLAGFLRNFLTPTQQVAGHAGALVLQLAGFCALALAAATILSGGDFRFAAWYTAVMGLAAALFLPVVLAVETVSDFRLPLVLVVLGLVIAVAAADALVGSERFLAGLGLQVTRYEPATLLPLVARVAVALPAGFAVVGVIHVARRRRGWRPWRARPARSRSPRSSTRR